MRYRDLSPEDQRLLNTDLGSFDKMASEHMSMVQQNYEVGFEKAAAVAEALDYSADYEGYQTRGMIEGLMKLGSDRFGDELAYILPFVEEKLATAAEAATKAPGAAHKAWEAIKAYHKGALKDITGKGRLGYSAVVDKAGKPGIKTHIFGKGRSGSVEAMTGGEKAKSVARGALKFSPYLALAGGGTYAATRKNGEE